MFLFFHSFAAVVSHKPNLIQVMCKIMNREDMPSDMNVRSVEALNDLLSSGKYDRASRAVVIKNKRLFLRINVDVLEDFFMYMLYQEFQKASSLSQDSIVVFNEYIEAFHAKYKPLFAIREFKEKVDYFSKEFHNKLKGEQKTHQLCEYKFNITQGKVAYEVIKEQPVTEQLSQDLFFEGFREATEDERRHGESP
ncbi:MAG: hypothetical protein H6850_03160 [Alphaproteobacteria bacterium]|nr:MAG: hypothetical protein H6850_03160 [Alphaproteobacteria bacterium]